MSVSITLFSNKLFTTLEEVLSIMICIWIFIGAVVDYKSYITNLIMFNLHFHNLTSNLIIYVEHIMNFHIYVGAVEFSNFIATY